MKNFLKLDNCSAVSLDEIPVLGFADFRQTLIDSTGSEKLRVSAFFPLKKGDKELYGNVLCYLLNDVPHNESNPSRSFSVQGCNGFCLKQAHFHQKEDEKKAYYGEISYKGNEIVGKT